MRATPGRILRVVARVACAMACAAGPASAQAPEDEGPDLILRGAIGFGGHFSNAEGEPGARPGIGRAGRWFPIWVEVENRRKEEEFRGTIVLTPSATSWTADRAVTVRAPIHVAPKSRARVQLLQRLWTPQGWPDPMSDPIAFRLEAVESRTGRPPRGGVVDGVPAPMSARDRLVVAVVGGQALQSLAQAVGSLCDARRAARIEADQLPTRFAGYDGCDVLVWPRPTTDEGDPAVVAAVAEWVQAGGVLVLGCGDGPPTGMLARLCPAKVGEPQQVPVFASLPVEPPARRDSPEVLRSLAPLAGARVVHTETSGGTPVPWSVERPLGAGRVVAIGADLDAAPFRQGASAFWTRIAGGGRAEPPALESTELVGGGIRTTLADSVTRAVADVERARAIPFGWLAAFLGVYILLIGPIDYLCLRRLNRLEWTFLTFTLVTVAVTISAWVVSHRLKGGEMLLRAIVVRTSRADVAGSRAEAVAGIFANAHADLVVRHEARAAGTGLFRVQSAEHGAMIGRDVAVGLNDHGAFVASAPVRIWTTEWFHAAWSDPRPAPVTGRLTVEGGRLTGRLTLAADRRWRDVLLLWGDRCWTLTSGWNAQEVLEVAVGPSGPALDQALLGALAGAPLPPAGAGTWRLIDAATHVRAASAGLRIGAREPWGDALRLAPGPGEALLLAFAEGDLSGLDVPGHTPEPEGVAVERVFVPVDGAGEGR